MASSLTTVVTASEVSWLLSCAIKASLLLAASWLGAALLRRGTAAARHQIWTLGVVGALLVPLLCWALPSLPLALPSLSLSSERAAVTGSFAAPAVFVTGGAATTAAAAPINACVNKLVSAGHYPPSIGGPVDVSFPFVFTAATVATR